MRTVVHAYRLTWAFALIGVVTSLDSAYAQVLGPLLDTELPFDLRDPQRPTVLERPRPELAPLGVSTGPVQIFPEIEVTPGYTSNVFGAARDNEDDAYMTVAPSVTARTRWSRHMVGAYARGNFRRYLSNSIRNYSGYNSFVEGRLDLPGQSNIYGQLRADKVFIEQYSGDFPSNAAGPVPLDRRTAILRGTYQQGRVRLIGNADVNRLDFGSTSSLSGAILNQDFRDETVWRFSGRAEYRLDSARLLFVQGSRADHDFTNRTTGQLNRSGSETRVLAGAAFYPSPVIRARVGLGYLWRRYDDRSVTDLKALALDVQADYLVTQLTTVSLAVRREAQDAILANSPGYVATRIQARVDHEYLRNLLIRAQVDYERDKFVDVDRRDIQLRLEAGAEYTPFRHIVIDPTAQFIKRESKGTLPGQRFDELRILLRTTLRY